jgi:hypothetical protein
MKFALFLLVALLIAAGDARACRKLSDLSPR